MEVKEESSEVEMRIKVQDLHYLIIKIMCLIEAKRKGLDVQSNQITLYGWYKPKNAGNNLNGVSRDHIFSRNEGYKELIDPYLISHPANCQLMQHSLNASKSIKCDISLDELKNKINIWTQKYGEYPNKINYDIFLKFDIIFKK